MRRGYVDAPTFFLSSEDLERPFEEFFERNEQEIAKYGIAKIVAPSGFRPCAESYADVLRGVVVSCPVQQTVQSVRGLFRFIALTKPDMDVDGFQRYATTTHRCPPERIEGCVRLPLSPLQLPC